MRCHVLRAMVLMACMSGIFGLVPARAQLFETRAGEAVLMDGATGTILFAKNADKEVPPASLAKLMTLEVVFHAIKTGHLKLDDTFQVSENAWRNGGAMSGGSTMFAKVHSTIKLEDLIQGIIVQSANDACITIAEGMAGSESNFARMMTERAREIGLKNSVFDNATGLPDPRSHVTMRDLVMLARHLHDDYPDLYHYFGEDSFTWNNIRQRNRNPLIAMGIGVDGLKTGFTDASGYAIVASMAQGGRRLYLAMSGMKSERERAEESRKMLEWGMRAFEKKALFAKGAIVGDASVYGGATTALPLKARGPIDIFVPVSNPDKLTAKITYHWPVMAPVSAGTRIGTLSVFLDNTLSQQTPLYAAETIGKGSLYKRALDALQEMMLSWL